MKYQDAEKFTVLVDLFKKEMISFDHIKPLLLNVLDFDDSPDLTDILPRDRNNVSVNVIFLYDQYYKAVDEVKSKFFETREFVQSMQGVQTLKCIAIGPNSIVPLHLDDMNRPAYDLNDWYSVLLGVDVPSEDTNIIALKSGETIFNHAFKQTIIIDTQIPHEAWNHSDEWWIMLRLSIKKDFFKD